MKKSAPSRPSLILSLADNPVAFDLVLEAVSLQTHPPLEVLIADDGSGEQTTAIVEKWRRQLFCRIERFWQPHEEFRRGVTLNEAVRAATGDYLIFIDGDCLPHRRFIADHLRHAAPGTFVQGRRAGIRARYVRRLSAEGFHPWFLVLRRQLYGARRGLRRPWAAVRLSPRCVIQGSNFAVWREDFFRVNGYDENFVGSGHEDAELAARLSNAGLSCKTVVGQLIVYHLDHPRVRRYSTAVNERILEQTKREKRIRCDRGIAQHPPQPTAARTTALL